jgi:hypothetical protein
VVAIPYATMEAKPSVCADLPGAPECFFIQLNQCYYFKLYSYAPHVARTISGDTAISNPFPPPPRALDRAGS